jgi:hypothetical protein
MSAEQCEDRHCMLEKGHDGSHLRPRAYRRYEQSSSDGDALRIVTYRYEQSSSDGNRDCETMERLGKDGWEFVGYMNRDGTPNDTMIFKHLVKREQCNGQVYTGNDGIGGYRRDSFCRCVLDEGHSGNCA